MMSCWPSLSALSLVSPLASAILYQSEESPQSEAAIEESVSPPWTTYMPPIEPLSFRTRRPARSGTERGDAFVSQIEIGVGAGICAVDAVRHRLRVAYVIVDAVADIAHLPARQAMPYLV